MGNDMTTYAARLRLRAGRTESDVVGDAKRALAVDEDEQFRTVRLGATAVAVTLEQLFAAFEQSAVRAGDGTLIAAHGYDHRYTRPEPLWAAIAPAVLDGSWIAYATELGPHLVTFTGGHAAVVAGFTTPGGLPLEDWAAPRPGGEGPALTGDVGADVTAFVRYVTGRTDLGDGIAPTVS